MLGRAVLPVSPSAKEECGAGTRARASQHRARHSRTLRLNDSLAQQHTDSTPGNEFPTSRLWRRLSHSPIWFRAEWSGDWAWRGWYAQRDGEGITAAQVL